MKCVVVGGGITGCISALELKRRGHNVKLLEADTTLGGILKDALIENQVYFSNCQYISANAPWLKLLSTKITDQLFNFEHKYGSLTSYNGESLTSNDVAIPIFRFYKIPEISTEKLRAISTLKDRLNCYPSHISSMLNSWVSRFGVNPSILSSKNANAIQISRIYIEGKDFLSAKLKKESEAWNNLLGLPRAKRNLDIVYEPCLLPLGGYNSFFSKMSDELTDKGIEVETNSPVTIKKSNSKKPELLLRGEAVAYEKLIWACNPVPLFISMGLGRLNNLYGKANVTFMKCRNGYKPDTPFYVQVYSLNVPVFRIFIYTINGNCAATIEGFDSDQAPTTTANQVNKILSNFGIDADFFPMANQHQKRYIFYSPNDLHVFNQFDQHTNVISGEIVNAGWSDYARDIKIERILDTLGSKSNKVV